MVKGGKVTRTVALCAVGAAAGAVNGIFGTGGGTVMVFALLWLLRNDPPDGQVLFANVCCAVLPIAAVSALAYSSFAPIDLGLSAAIALSALAGGLLGALLLGKLGTKTLKIIFAAVMIVGGGIMALK